MLAPPPLPRTLDAALRDLTSSRAATRASAIGDLVSHALSRDDVRARAVPLLEAALKGDDAPEPRAAAAVGLGDLRAVEALPALLVAIEDANVQVRQMALNALGEVGDSRALPRLERALADARPDVRYQAIIAYAKVASDPGDVGAALARACADADDAVRYIALRIAEERADAPGAPPTAPAVLAEARVRVSGDLPHVVLAAAIVLAKAGEEPLDAARTVILSVVRGGRLLPDETRLLPDETRLLPDETRLLADETRLAARWTGPDKEDEREAVELAGALGLREATPDLERRAWGLGSLVRDTCAWHARIALARMGHPRAIAEILKDLDAKRPETRAAAIVAAGRSKLEDARAKLETMKRAGGVDADLLREALARLEG